MLRTGMAEAIVTQIGPRARIVGTEALRAGSVVHGTGRYVCISVVVVRVVATVITIIITIVIVGRAKAERDGGTAESPGATGGGKNAASVPIVAGPVARAVIGGGKALAAVGAKVPATDRAVAAADRAVAGPVAATAHAAGAAAHAHAAAAPAHAHAPAASAAAYARTVAPTAAVAVLHLFDQSAALQRHVCVDRRRTGGTGPDSADGHQ